MESQLPSLEPVVIPAIFSGKFSCQGDGLFYEGHKMETVENFKAWLFPKRASTKPFKRLKAWWQAQLKLYGLDPGKSSSTVADLTQRLKEAVAKGLRGPSDEMSSLEQQLNRQFRMQNAQAREAKYLAVEGDEGKAEFWPRRFLEERFPVRGKGRGDAGEPVVLKIQRRAEVHEAAGTMGLHTISADAPGGGNARWLIVGRNRAAVWRRKSEIEAERARLLDQQRDDKRRKVEKAAQKLESQTVAKTGGYRDVVGEWSVESQDIADQWDVGDLRMSIFFDNLERETHSEDDSEESEEASYDSEDASYDSEDSPKPKRGSRSELPTGSELLWASFDFGVLEGIMRAQAVHPASGSFPLNITFAWRGRETGENVIEIDYHNKNRTPTTFLSSTRLKGELKSGLGDFKFVGRKVSNIPRHTDSDKWNHLTERQYERERVGRWR